MQGGDELTQCLSLNTIALGNFPQSVGIESHIEESGIFSRRYVDFIGSDADAVFGIKLPQGDEAVVDDRF